MSIDTHAVEGLDVPEFMRPERPKLSVVKDEPGPVEGTVVEHQGAAVAKRPAWTQSTKTLAARARSHAVEHRLYVGWTARGYRDLGRRWLDARRDDYPQMIHSARVELKAAAGDVAAEDSARRSLTERRAEYRLHKRWHWIKTGAWGSVASAAGTSGMVFGGLWVDMVLALGAMVVGAWNGRPEVEAAPVPAGELATVDGVVPGAGQLVYMTVDQLAEDGKPFPVAAARTPTQFAECVLRGLLAEGVPVVEVSDVVQHPWGWQCIVRVSEGTPQAIIKAADALETAGTCPPTVCARSPWWSAARVRCCGSFPVTRSRRRRACRTGHRSRCPSPTSSASVPPWAVTRWRCASPA